MTNLYFLIDIFHLTLILCSCQSSNKLLRQFLSIFNLSVKHCLLYGAPSIESVMRLKPFGFLYLCAVLPANLLIKRASYISLCNGGLKWTRTIDVIAYVRSFLPIFFAHSNLRYFGGLKWTRTIDLTLIRRVL